MTRNSKKEGSIAGARGSTAGDVYHELWALRAALSLLMPKTELQAVTVEGVGSPTAGEDRYAAVDCGLFYGGKDISTATAIELVQLKYSTSKPTLHWTVARLIASDASSKDNSVIRKLATSFAEANKNKSAAATLKIKLVSNQPVASAALDAVRKVIGGNRTDEDCKKLVKASGLKATAITAFFTSLSFEGMGGPSRVGLQDAITKTVSLMAEEDIDDRIGAQRTKIRELMTPGRERDIITAATVRLWFGVSSATGIFPAPADLQPLGSIIKRAPTDELLAALAKGERLICLDGAGGCGKTTTMRQLGDLLPRGSIFVLYDCYGAGRYMYSDQKRHLPEVAFLQIVNEIAFEQGLPLLMPNASSKKADIRTFMERVSRSAELLKKASPDGILAILVDAADNSVNAAENYREACFARDIATANLTSLPANIAIIFSTRSARKPNLNLPARAASVPCPEFTPAETRAFSDLFIAPPASQVWVDQFHHFTRAIPRVQSVAMKAGSAEPTKVMQFLMPDGKGLADVLEAQLREAALKVGDEKFHQDCIAALSALPPPIPVKYLAEVCSVSESIVTDFINDIAPSLRLESAGVTIADEDTEDFLEAASKANRKRILTQACIVLAPVMETDAYAATHYCDLLTADGRAQEVLSIVEKDLEPKGISDPVVKREVQLRRLRLAMNACASKSDPTDMIKVALLGAEATKDEAALRELLEQRPELSVRFAEASLQRLILSDYDRFSLQGAALAHQADSAARNGDLVTAREMSYLFEKWCEAVRALPNEERTGIRLTLDDSAAVAEARVVTYGADRYIDDLISNWRHSYQVEMASRLVPQLIVHGNAAIVRGLLKTSKMSALRKVFLAVPLAMAGEVVATDGFAKALKQLRKRVIPDLRRSLESWEGTYLEYIVTACEIAFSRAVAKSTLNHALDSILDHRASPSSEIRRSDGWQLDIAIRAWTLREYLAGRVPAADGFLAFCADMNEPPSPLDAKKDKKKAPTDRYTAEERELFKRAVNAIFGLYEARVDVLADAAAGKALGDIAKRLPGLGDDYSFNRQYYANDCRIQAGRSVSRIMHIKGMDIHALMARAIEIAKSDSDGVTAFRTLPIWREFLIRPQTQAEILKGVTKRGADMMNVRVGSKEKADTLLEFSHLVLNFSIPDAQALFNQAVEIAKEIDRDAMMQIQFIARLAKVSSGFDPVIRRQLAIRFASFVTDVGIRLEGYDHFPWHSAVGGLYELVPEVALAAVSQWHDEGLERMSGTLPSLVAMMAKDNARLGQACALTFLLRVFPAKTFRKLAVAANARLPAEARALLELLSRKAELDTAEDRRGEMEDALLGQSQFANFPLPMGSYVELSKRAREPMRVEKKKKERTKPIAFAAGAKFATADEIRQSLTEVRERLKGQYVARSAILRALRTKITTLAQRVPYLNALTILDSPLDADENAIAILEALQEWKGQPAVEDWRKIILPRVIQENFAGFARWIHEGQSKLPQLLAESALEGQQMLALVGGALQKSAEDLSSGALYSVCAMLGAYLASDDAKVLAEWYVARISKHLLPDITDRFESSAIPENWEEALGRLLFAMLSDIDLRIRWRTAHCLRHLTALDGGRALAAMVAHYDRTKEPAFRLHTSPFYWMAARLWTVTLLARIALENPTAVSLHAAKLLQIVEDDIFPHYLIRYHAKRAIEHLQAAGAVTLSPKQQRSLDSANKPALPSVSVKRGFSRDLERSGGKGRRFGFNSLDTIPYWYSPLYGHFAKLTPDQFFQALEHWVVDEWGADDTANHWDKEFRKGRISDSESMKTYHGHGSQPTIERYGLYLEFHAMFCALGELIKTAALRKPEDDSDSIEYWLHRWLPTEGDTWLADRRLPRPLGNEFKISLKGADKGWLKSATDEQFVSYILGTASDLSTPVTIYSGWTTAGESREVRVEVTTAFVEPATASALARALTDSEESYSLPTETDHEDSDSEYRKAPFRLLPTVRLRNRDTEIDKDDPLRKDVSEMRAQPAVAMLEKHGLQATGMPVSMWQRKGKTVARYEAWSESEDRENSGGSRRELGVEGYRLTVDKSELSAMLDAEAMDLVVEVAVERRLEDKYGERSSWNDETKRKKVRKAYIFRQNGDIEGVAGRVGAWQ
jgi:hypothetical protein